MVSAYRPEIVRVVVQSTLYFEEPAPE